MVLLSERPLTALCSFVSASVLLRSESDCLVLNKYLSEVALSHRYAKFCVIRAQEAIHNFPNHKCPTVLVYCDGNIIRQIEKLGPFGGPRASAQTVEWVLAQPCTVRPAGTEEDVTHHILQTQLTENPLNRENKMTMHKKKAAKGYDSEDDSDED